MTKTELIALIAERAGLTKAHAADALKVVETTIAGQLASGGEVVLTGFGKFIVRETAARTGRNPSTGEEIQIPAGRKPVFVAGKTLKDAVNS